ncbi:HAD family hydrolase [Neptunomonas antarctica]|uniref:phosphoglycolate phosphatase n=1 Tax=Neptunomonas antarctica TaxID=619304 RepID=A0A1N7JDC7_9GAMM|nr:HAD family hydrolase [Neptunomonas antarctica]SIS47274.1 Phosphoglycolate phosphatase, HAD superfamily [Neptunomonas antarctica]
MNLRKYNTFIFDCDGVLLDSNRLKTAAFYQAVESYGDQAAEKFIQYHIENGGVSRYKKIDYFFNDILKVTIENFEKERVLELYAHLVRDGLMKCKVASGLHALRKKYPATLWMVASGGDQKELREVFEARNLYQLFDGGIFGSPDDKGLIVKREKESVNFLHPAVFFGDSQLDHKVAKQEDIDFIFVHEWTEFSQWKKYCDEHQVLSINNLAEIS